MTNTCADECIFISQKNLKMWLIFVLVFYEKCTANIELSIYKLMTQYISYTYIFVFDIDTVLVFFLINQCHDDVNKWKHFPRYWPFVRGIHRWPVNSPHKGQWRGALVFSLICAWKNGWVNTGKAGDLGRHRGHYGVIVMVYLRHYITHKSIDFHKCISITLHTEAHFLMCKPR